MNKLRIGFPLARGGGGPTIFMRRLKDAVCEDGLAITSHFFDPRVDILVCANVIRNPWRKPYVLRLDGIAFDLTLGNDELNKRNLPIFKGIDKSSGLIFQSAFDKRLISSFHSLPNSPSIIIPNGVDLNAFKPVGTNLRSALGIKPEELVFLTSAKWRKHKRLDSVIEGFEAFCQVTKKPAHLLILGEVDKEIEHLPLGARIIGHIDPSELPQWYRTADIYLFFSWLDHCPNTVVEALASALPVLCTNQGGTRELVELTNGGIVLEVDNDFEFKEVELYKPPKPRQDLIVKGMQDIVAKKEQISAGINRETVGIQSVASRYVEFIKTINQLKTQ
ncbi:MAG: glycosyltransferase family 4 protein [Candidatus Accumulibacter sp.]|jgi:glycosyltransferase involved in cell wall biosynthesis|uniref:Glycosyltransferase family 4 protein n=1 Tax=Candidatus Accumulibacter proximus TaxID=2954385 RepID=A0A935UEE0_9PROT|nr:glycosyltransferase family 4 protein [Candidatus Accumulibacter proximus]